MAGWRREAPEYHSRMAFSSTRSLYPLSSPLELELLGGYLFAWKCTTQLVHIAADCNGWPKDSSVLCRRESELCVCGCCVWFGLSEKVINWGSGEGVHGSGRPKRGKRAKLQTGAGQRTTISVPRHSRCVRCICDDTFVMGWHPQPPTTQGCWACSARQAQAVLCCAVLCCAVRGRARQSKVGHGTAGWDGAGQGRAGQGRAGQGWVGRAG